MTDMQPDESLDLYRQLLDLFYSVPAADRRRAYWVMSREWRDRLVRYAQTVLTSAVPIVPSALLGLPFKLDDSRGFPELVIPDPGAQP